MTLTPPQMSSLVEMIQKRIADATDGTGIDKPNPSRDAFEPLSEPAKPIAIHIPVEYISLNCQYADDVILRFQAVPDESLPDLPAGHRSHTRKSSSSPSHWTPQPT